MARYQSDLPLWDFASVYASSRAWTQGQNPYDLPAVQEIWRAGSAFAHRDISYWATVYPPTSLALIAPLALLPSGIALGLWAALMLTLLMMQFAALCDMTRLNYTGWRAIVLVGVSLASAPLQFGLLSGQLSIPAASLCILALWCERRRGFTKWGYPTAGLLLGLACALKPQLAVPFLVYYVFLRRNRPTVSVVALSVLSVITAGSLLAMHWSHIDWFNGWTNCIAQTTVPGGVNDYEITGPYRDQIVDLKMVVTGFVADPLHARVIVECLFIALGAAFVRSLPKSREIGTDRAGGLLPLVALVALSLLPLYHRVYDATLLTLGVAWALGEWHSPRRKLALIAAAPGALFLVPFDVLRSVTRHVSFARKIDTGWFWQAIVVPHYAWALLTLTLSLLYVMSRLAVARTATVPTTAVPSVEPQLDTDDDDEAILAH